MSLIVSGPVPLAAWVGEGVGGKAEEGVERLWSRERTAERTGSVSTVSAESPSGREIVEEG